MRKMLSFDASGAFLPQTGLEPSDVASLGTQLEKLRDELCEIDVRMLAGEIPTPSSKQPLDAGFYLMPERLLSEYAANRTSSELARILAATKRLMGEVDRVVILDLGGSNFGAKAIMDACCQPYFNELTRGQRGSRPRIYFAENPIDNDATQGLLHLLGAHRERPATCVNDRWGLIAVGQATEPLDTAIALRQFLSALDANCGCHPATVASRVIPIASDPILAACMPEELGCAEIFSLPQQVGTGFTVLSAVGLVPAALMGINVMKLLEGAKAMNEHFRSSKATGNVVLQYAAVNHLMETKRGSLRLLCVWTTALESAGFWLDQLLAECLGKSQQTATPMALRNTRAMRLGQQPRDFGCLDKLINHVVVESSRFDPLVIDQRSSNVEGPNVDGPRGIAGKKLIDIMAAQVEAMKQSLRDDHRPSTTLSMPCVDEFYLGQFFQMMMLATVIEGRLLGINPYRRANTEAYQTHLNHILSR